jgi:hypothetical protein
MFIIIEKKAWSSRYQDKKQPPGNDSASFDQDCETLVRDMVEGDSTADLETTSGVGQCSCEHELNAESGAQARYMRRHL